MGELNDSELLFGRLQSFCEINEQFFIAFKVTERTSALTRLQKNALHINYIANNILPNPQYFQNTVDHFSEYLPKIVSCTISSYQGDNSDPERHLRNCILLGKLVKERADLEWFASKYFETNPPPFIKQCQIGGKKRRLQKFEMSDLEIVESCYSLLKSNLDFYKRKWCWSDFFDKYLNHESDEVQWIACHCICLVCSMSENQLKQLILSKVSNEVHEKLSCIYNFNATLKESCKIPATIDQNPCISIKKEIEDEVVDISGIYIPKLPFKGDPPESKLIIVKSTYANLRKISLGLTCNRALCLQGPVGSGKTTLVEHLAAKTGRKLGENFIKVQLGDQTDSKMLLGTYRCTDVPGEFIWQPGVVTQAVIEGHWLLLEDIDSASMDIASVLSSLLENGTLAVPGYRDSLSIKPGFQLFFTQRLVSTITGHHKKHSNAMTLLEKHLQQINIDPLTSDELKQILTTLYPQFSTIADRMLSVFHLFSKENSNVINLPKTTRLISTRDFFKWCSRAAIDFDVSSQSSALKVLQDAIDVFCCSYPNVEDALNLAREISTHLGIINQKAEFFFKNYKPNMQLTASSLIVGRAAISRNNDVLVQHQSYFFTRPSAVLLERIMCCINLKEPVLLVGETGTGKTSTVQYLAKSIGQKLIVINMNQQSDSADLLGGFKPVDLKFIVAPIRREFEYLFGTIFKLEPNKTFLGHISYCFNEQRWSDLVKLMMKSYEAAMNRENKPEMLERWRVLGEKLQKLNLQLKQKTALAFAFIEGSLVKAVEQGHWVLLDEINLANAETLECLSGLLEGSQGSLCLLERGDKQPVKRHPDFTLFACMNPSTDVGKKDLPAGLRNRFTEFFVDELTERSDLHLLVSNYLNALSLKEMDLDKIVGFYLKVRKAAEATLTDGLSHKPHFSLRSLCRALMISAKNPCGMMKKSLYEAFCLSFLTQLDAASYIMVEKMIAKCLIGDEKSIKALLKQPIPEPVNNSENSFVQFEGYWVRKGDLECCRPDDYILTDSVRKNLKDLVRIVSIGGLPVLLQGDTSVGKTSLITYLAKSSGNKCVRINNHEHTDLQEYVGSYVADCEGKLVFREGLLVEAMRKGHWIILDELNLAPTDVLEALNRVLDDNRELFIPETQQTVKANPNFMLFATQNPPGSYGGRKMLSRAFRNRFVELHFNEIPAIELKFILHKRCEMAPSYAEKMVNVMKELQMRRRGSAAFAGKQGFITLRDLFRWGERYRLAQNSQKLYDWDQHLADEGYLLLAGRVRKAEEKKEIVAVLQKYLKREVNPTNLFTLSQSTSLVTRDILEKIDKMRAKFTNIVWTYNMRQLAVLVAKAFQFKEPVLLVGETGGGKTTVCKIIAEQNNQELTTINCHMHTESSDFIGGLRPVRDHVDDDINKLFEWVDGPLIQAMVRGDVFLADEISLADDSVLERLNSLLEPERTLLLAEKGTDINNATNSELIVAHSRFYFIGTMNPGGDFGKKELSPALRNRFTEIWCEACTDRDDLIAIIEQNLTMGISFGNQQDGSSGIGKSIMDFIEWFQKTEIGKRFTISIRDILTWVNFINACAGRLDVHESYTHGACLTFLDSLGSGVTGTENLRALEAFRVQCEKFLQRQLLAAKHPYCNLSQVSFTVKQVDNSAVGIEPFFIEMGDGAPTDVNFSFNAPTTIYNTLRLLRGMQLHKAILLEGSPGVGKTSLVTALAKFARHKLFRVNLSDQTDISDLFGADLPVEGGTGGQFSWRDGPLLQALKQGHWILLDELNLASQSVLEGLNACLDHRGEIFIPELGKTFHVKPGTRFFACQNPLKQGGSRRGLPQSFLNRFIQVYVNSLSAKDLQLILTNQFPQLSRGVLHKMLEFNNRVLEELSSHNFGNKGSPWEFNLRDLTRWCEATLYHYEVNGKRFQPENLVHLIYGDRMRTLSDKVTIGQVFREVFTEEIAGNAPVLYVTNDKVCFGDVSLARIDGGDIERIGRGKSLVLRSQLPILRSLAYCVNLNWMSLLVGGSASGKSTVVRCLANLVGKTLRTLPVTSAMDTTDILGGFEQTDYTRHLEEIAKATEHLLLKTVRAQVVKGQPCIELLSLWESYSNLDDVDGDKRTMEAEAKLFLKKLAKLEGIWDALESFFADGGIVAELRSRGIKMGQSVRREGSLNAGGKFEWVDSILIKCLQEGSWLLVDNVNLCSAAVLDRLNALLEPQGVLTVSERGVDAFGRMVEIRPHPDFRLFLTMDPKNGEISRAMRNRGVEIYMLNEKESGQRNNFDVKSLVNRAGLSDVGHINTLLDLHDFVGDLILGEKPNVDELLRASALISQQIQHRTPTPQAFLNTIMEVYYKTRSSMEFNCNDFATVVETEIEKLLMNDLCCGFCPDVTQSTDRIQTCSDLEKIKQESACLQLALTQHKSAEAPSDYLKFLLIQFYAISSAETVKMRRFYLDGLLKIDNFKLMSVKLAEFLQGIAVDAREFPLDCRWLPETEYPGKSLSVSNLIVLGLHIVANLQTEAINSKGGNIPKQITLLQYMNERRLKKIDDQFDDILVENFMELIERYNAFLMDVIRTDISLNNEQVVEILNLLKWRFILHRCTLANIKKITATQRYLIVTNLKVHYRWFLKYSLNGVRAVLNRELPQPLKAVVTQINNSLEKQFSDLHGFSKNFQKFCVKPPPQVAETQIALATLYQQIVKKYDICDKSSDHLAILTNFLQNPSLKLQLIDVKLNSDTCDGDKISMLKELDGKLSSNDNKSIPCKYQVEMLPFADCFIRLSLGNSQVCQVEEFKACAAFPTALATSLLLYSRTKDERLQHELTTGLFGYLMNSAAVKPRDYRSEMDKKLAQFSPMIVHHVLGLLVGDAITKLGNFTELSRQHRQLTLGLWRNCQQLQRYDFLNGERRSIMDSFALFIRNLAQSLNINHADFDGLIEQCQQKLATLKSDGGIAFVGHFNNCIANFANIDKVEGDRQLLIMANLRMELNYVKAVLNSRLPLIDPSAKKALKKKYCEESVGSFENLRDSFRMMNEVFSGNENALHGHYQPVTELITNLRRKNEKLGAYVAVRPRDILYEEVVKVVNHGFVTILSHQYVDKIIADLNGAITGLERAEEILKQYESAVSSFENLIYEWSRYRASYPDVIEPLLSNVSEFLYGFNLALELLRKKIQERSNAEFCDDVQEALVSLVRMPSLDQRHTRYQSLIESYSKLHGFIKHTEGSANVESLRLYKCAIQESYNNCVVASKGGGGHLNRKLFIHFDSLIKEFIRSWNRQEEERELREKEADALYKIKSKCDDKTEAEQIAEELRELFPNYHEQDFADMQKTQELTDDDPDTKSTGDKFVGFISNDDVKFVADIHINLVQTFTKSEWLNPEKTKKILANFIQPLMEKFKVFKTISDQTIDCLDYTMNAKLMESLQVLAKFIQSHGNTADLVEQSSPTRSQQSKRYDFYKDANVAEVKASYHILQELKLRIVQLLEEWPEQPTLKTILAVIERICDFDVTSPVSRFLTGLEILLTKCNEWEEVAHAGVSLSQFSQNITHQIIAWRKMELGVWKDLLNCTFNRLAEPVYKWWLYLYRIMEQFINEDKFTNNVELVETLQRYITEASLVEFQSRLNLLHVFHCHTVNLPRTDKSVIFINILWNLHAYYQQFSGIVANKIKDLRAPIEKKLKDYVKIVRWKDINYWAIKETVDKSHKTLHKYVREFQDVLRQPVAACLVNTADTTVENVGIWDRPQRNLVKTYHYTLDPATYVAKETLKKKLGVKASKDHQELFNKADLCFSEMRRQCKDSIVAMKYPKLIQNLDNFVTEVIETSSHLQNLEVDGTLPKAKQKAHAKSILQQKHRALADLFKTLSKIGLSFKSGIVEAQLKTNTGEFLLRPIDIGASFSHINYNRKDEKILTIWDSCEMYYLKALMRAGTLDTALNTPAPDLGIANIDRCRGFASHLLSFAHKQKAGLVESSTAFYCLRHYTNQMAKLCEAKTFLNSETIDKALLLMKNINIVAMQSKLILNACPEENCMESMVEVLILQPEPSPVIQYKNDALWSKAMSCLAELITAANKFAGELEKSKGEIPCFSFDLVSLSYVPVGDVKLLEKHLDEMTKSIDELTSILGLGQVSNSFFWLKSELDKIKDAFNTEKKPKTPSRKSLQQLQKLASALTDDISNTMKNIYEKYSNIATEVSPEDLDEEDDQIELDHLKLLIVDGLEKDYEVLKMDNILNSIHKIAGIFFATPPPHLDEPNKIVSVIIPLLEQVILFSQYFITQQTSAYRVTCKMSSVLLNIFINLASKGFCVPPELTDEEEEGIGKPSDGLGLGEGQGERDVSDKIESEDQLDDAQPAGQEKQPQEDPDCKEEEKGIEMSEDFDSKLQDVEQKDDEDEESSDSDADEQMGETDKDANRQDKENFGSDEEEGDGINEEQKEEKGEGGEKEGEEELGAKDDDQTKTDDDKLDKDSSKEKEQNKKDINEMEEPEIDDDQTDPYHGNQPELPEPEAMDLPDDLQLDDGQENENEEQNEENPFDIDAMKEDNPFEEKEKADDEEEKEQQKDDENNYSSEDEDITSRQDDEGNNEEEKNEEDPEQKEDEGVKEATKDDEMENEEADKDDAAFDSTQTNQDNVQAMETEQADALDKTQPNETQNQKPNQPIEELCQEDKPDKEGVGHSQMEESATGHSAQTTAPQEMQSTKRPREEEAKKKQKPGESDSQRSLGDVNEPVKKKLKTIDNKNDGDEEEGDEDNQNEEQDAEMYQHIKEAKETSTQVLDVATKEQTESQKMDLEDLEEKDEEKIELPDEPEENIESVDTPVQKSEKTDSNKSKTNDKKQHPDGDVLDEVKEVEVEGEVVETMNVPRGLDTTYHTLYDDLKKMTATRLTVEEINSLRSEVEQQLSAWTEMPSDAEADRAWQKISSVTSSLAQDLSEQLRLVLEPTQASRLRGDFRTGRRINMRKVIPYIASQFRKDKIWLRRTKPSKREYQIVLAIDDSASMDNNHSKELAFESVALISKALTLLESGQLSIMSFGEKTEVLHKLTDQFTEKTGVKLLQKFKFGQNQTCVGDLVNFVAEMFVQNQMQSSALNAKLLVVVGDGRGVFSEGESLVRDAVRRAKLANIFMVFVIIDNPQNKNSILDIRMPFFENGKLMGFQNYMDVFPFSFYIILRDINSLPNVLSDALRQWFEVVSNLDKQ